MDEVILTSDYDTCLLYNNPEHWAEYSFHKVACVPIIIILHMFKMRNGFQGSISQPSPENRPLYRNSISF